MKCRRLLGQAEEAEEAAHESFARLLQAGPAWTDERDTRVVMAWLYKTCTRLCIDRLRKRRKLAGQAELDAPVAGAMLGCRASIEDALTARRLVARMSAEVAPDELEAVVLCRVDGLSQPEASAVLGVSDRTVRRLLERFDASTAQLRKEFAS
jgi:RNA polymerase sigma-70 factor (ECF subfamily)